MLPIAISWCAWRPAPCPRASSPGAAVAAFLTWTECGKLAGLLAAPAVVLASFPLFCAVTFFDDTCAAVVLSFRPMSPRKSA
ncbi:hypothetical protein [Roseomonas sp. KE2513]|uniref:hypothetical protein n=1 Tax=Roseomonas sp. KE2513 TaxID=2479202 RepID=UPI0018DF9F70|nr:hypothetical protein [Roseomonas sp. KE2513]